MLRFHPELNPFVAISKDIKSNEINVFTAAGKTSLDEVDTTGKIVIVIFEANFLSSGPLFATILAPYFHKSREGDLTTLNLKLKSAEEHRLLFFSGDSAWLAGMEPLQTALLDWGLAEHDAAFFEKGGNLRNALRTLGIIPAIGTPSLDGFHLLPARSVTSEATASSTTGPASETIKGLDLADSLTSPKGSPSRVTRKRAFSTDRSSAKFLPSSPTAAEGTVSGGAGGAGAAYRTSSMLLLTPSRESRAKEETDIRTPLSDAKPLAVAAAIPNPSSASQGEAKDATEASPPSALTACCLAMMSCALGSAPVAPHETDAPVAKPSL